MYVMFVIQNLKFRLAAIFEIILYLICKNGDKFVIQNFVLLTVSMVTHCLLLVVSHYEAGIGRSLF